MNKTNLLFILGAMLWINMNAPQARADEGHDHGEALAATSATTLPRFAAVSPNFELVGILDGKDLTLYLDHYADGSPVQEARLELEINGLKVNAEAHGEGEFEATLATEPSPGVIKVAAAVITAAKTETLTGEFDLHDEEAPANARPHEHGYLEYMAGGAMAVAALLALFFLARRLRGARHFRSGGVA